MSTNDIKNLKSKLQSSVDKAAENKKAADKAKAEKLAEEQRLLEEKRLREEEARRKEEERLREEERLKEEARRQEEARKKEEEKRKFEEKLKEKARLAEEKKRIKAEKKKARRQANRAAKAAILAEAQAKAEAEEKLKKEAEEEALLAAEGEECPPQPTVSPEKENEAAREEIPALPEITEEIEEAEEESIPYDPITPEEFEKSIEEHAFEITKKSAAAKLRDNIIQLALIAIFASVFVACAVWLAKDIHGKIKGENLYSQTSDNFNAFIPGGSSDKKSELYSTMSFSASDASMQTLYERLSSGITDHVDSSSEYSEQLMSIRASITSLREINDDVYGWIYVDGTRINYPILRGEDNEYYLDRFYTKEYLAIGSIFADCSTKDVVSDNYNTVLYGHNVSTGAMFHDVTTFLQQDVFETKLIYIYTMDGIYTFKPYSIYQTTSDQYYFKTDFADHTEMLAFAQSTASKSKFETGITFSATDRLLTLSTCVNSTSSTQRYALHAVLVEIIK